MFNEGSINSELPRGQGLFNMFISYLGFTFPDFCEWVLGLRLSGLSRTGYSLEEVPEKEIKATCRCEINQHWPWDGGRGPDLCLQTCDSKEL